MARAPVFGPRRVRQNARQRTRSNLSRGVIRQRVSKGVFVELDVSPLYLAVADGVAEAVASLLADASENAPDDPTTPGSRIRDAGGFAVYAFGQIIDVEGSTVGWKKPRSFRPSKEGIDAVVSFRSGLHHLHELGTVHMPARPYLGPARMRIADRVPGIIARHMPRGGPP